LPQDRFLSAVIGVVFLGLGSAPPMGLKSNGLRSNIFPV
jgi:hypothetical protein